MKQDLPFLKHIRDEVDFLLKETESVRYELFLENELLKRACARSLEVIGEAVKNLSDDFREQRKDVE